MHDQENRTLNPPLHILKIGQYAPSVRERGWKFVKMLWLDNCRVARLIRTGPGRYRVGGVGCSNLETPLAIQALKIDFPLSDLDLATAIRSARTVEDRIQNQEPERSSKRRSRPRARMARNRSRMPVDAPGGLGRGSGRETGRDAPGAK